MAWLPIATALSLIGSLAIGARRTNIPRPDLSQFDRLFELGEQLLSPTSQRNRTLLGLLQENALNQAWNVNQMRQENMAGSGNVNSGVLQHLARAEIARANDGANRSLLEYIGNNTGTAASLMSAAAANRAGVLTEYDKMRVAEEVGRKQLLSNTLGSFAGIGLSEILERERMGVMHEYAKELQSSYLSGLRGIYNSIRPSSYTPSLYPNNRSGGYGDPQQWWDWYKTQPRFLGFNAGSNISQSSGSGSWLDRLWRKVFP